ncbi:ATP-dependent zinc metalloprotease FTSH 5, mitochondrial [Gracilariopsis chorda]|uniref:ATP-dependent zinc metalloprotease FTSH 5, mitochondrial n=1 Tax=Gracilariopsis chorda TaxID=448386 RepID=A0A2V3J6L5_9FLOR|nr:ATP-dependent zinc metalloprotease FTSH 5, mitochondrial [Gracilariopsis chorda]|eukprot:PXF50068.1 ATP-dependent zinc metalloprotease FTSH 5, mitochondrial [Gracilariopsis chorda]
MGPPGTGKTLLARAIAGEAKRPFFYASGSEFEEMFVGVGAKRVRELFAVAKQHAPCIVFIDEIDAIGGKRNPKDQRFLTMTLNQFLVEMDGFQSSEGIVVIGATNFPESLDKALIRPGRFDRHVVVPNPDVRGRVEILEAHTKKIPLHEDVDLEIIARGTPGFSGAELANLVNIAALKAAVDEFVAVTMSHLEFAKDRIMMGAERKSAALSEETRRMTAYHEGGHALCCVYTKDAFPVHKATIMPRGQALGLVAQLPARDMTSMSKAQMIAKIDVCMGGRAAEELIFGAEQVSSGASSDFEQATKLAEAMVTRYGMSEKLGMVVYDKERESGETRAVIEGEVKRIVDESYTRVKRLLKRREQELHRLADALLKYESLTGEQVRLAVRGELRELRMSAAPDKRREAQRATGADAVLESPRAVGGDSGL